MKEDGGLLVVLVVLFGVGVVAWLLLRPQEGTGVAGPQKLSFCQQAVGGASAVATGVASKGKVSVDNGKVDSAICSILNSVGAKITQIGKGVALAPSTVGTAVSGIPGTIGSVLGIGGGTNDFAKLDCATLRKMCNTSGSIFTSASGNSPACLEAKRRGCP